MSLPSLSQSMPFSVIVRNDLYPMTFSDSTKVVLRWCFASSLVLLIAIISYVHHSRAVASVDLSLLKSIQDLEQYTGRNVAVTGYINISFENSSIFFDDIRSGKKGDIVSCAVWVDLKSWPPLFYASNVHGKATVRGNLRLGHSGHLGVYNAELQEAEIIVPPWPSRVSPILCLIAAVMIIVLVVKIVKATLPLIHRRY